MPQPEEVQESHLSLLSQQITKNRDVINDLQHFLTKGMTIVQKQKNKKHKKKISHFCTPLGFKEHLSLDNSCSASGGILNKVNEEGPLESYFDIISLKIEVKPPPQFRVLLLETGEEEQRVPFYNWQGG